MPRQARLDVPGALYHIMLRGTDKSSIFRDDEDRSQFLNRLERNVTAAEAEKTKVPTKGHKRLSLRLVLNPSERFQTSWNDNHKERDLRNTTLVLESIQTRHSQ
jgi:N12 class adenine-specific DNA methylase